MTRYTQRNEVRKVSLVFLAYICPLEEAFLIFWYFIQSASLAFFRLTKASFNPLMQHSIGDRGFPKYIVLVAIEFVKTFSRTKCAGKLLLRQSTFYMFFAAKTFNQLSWGPSYCSAITFMTAKSAIPLIFQYDTRINLERFPTIYARLFQLTHASNHII